MDGIFIVELHGLRDGIEGRTTSMRDAAPYSGADRLHRSSLRNNAGRAPLLTKD
jgi:hypothetical protein